MWRQLAQLVRPHARPQQFFHIARSTADRVGVSPSPSSATRRQPQPPPSSPAALTRRATLTLLPPPTTAGSSSSPPRVLLHAPRWPPGLDLPAKFASLRSPSTYLRPNRQLPDPSDGLAGHLQALVLLPQLGEAPRPQHSGRHHRVLVYPALRGGSGRKPTPRWCGAAYTQHIRLALVSRPRLWTDGSSR